MKKAIFVGHYPNVVEPYLRSFFQALVHAVADQGIECTVIAPVSLTHYKKSVKKIEKELVEETSKGNRIKIFHPRYLSYSSRKIGFINTGVLSEKAFQKVAIKCAKKIKEKADFVYGHFFLTGGLAAVRIGRLKEIPSFVAYGECDYESQIKNDYGDIKTSDVTGLTGVISVSSKNTKELDDLGFVKGVPILTVPNSTDLNMFYKRERSKCRKELNLPQEAFIVGFVGGFIDRKGDKRLLEAVNGLENVYVAFAGRGDNPPAGEKVVFCKPIEHNLVPVFLNAVDVFCLPTLSEGSCNAIIEAMACGLPVISSNLPFNDDVLNDENSIRIDPRSVEEIRSAIEKLYKDRSELERLSFESIKKAQDLSINTRAQKILSFIEGLQNRKG